MATSPAGQIRRAVSSWQHTDPMEVSADPADVESVTIRYLMYVLLPAWFVPGIADYVMHLRTRIERTSGLGESAIHALMMAEISVPLLLTLLCEVNSLLPGISTAAAGVHEATAIWDVRAAVDGGREVGRAAHPQLPRITAVHDDVGAAVPALGPGHERPVWPGLRHGGSGCAASACPPVTWAGSPA
jgi:hypothetical protein